MTQYIIYNQDDGVPAIVLPTPEILTQRSILEIAIKDVPAGKKFKIIDGADLPTDYPQEAWSVNEADLTDGVGGQTNTFMEQT
jgi:hypothetical protein